MARKKGQVAIKNIKETGVITNRLPLTKECEPELNKYFKDEEAKTLNEVVQDKIKNDAGGW